MKTLCRYFLYATISFTLPSCAGTASDCAKTSCCKSQDQKVACCSKDSSKAACNKDGKKACNKDSAKACNKK